MTKRTPRSSTRVASQENATPRATSPRIAIPGLTRATSARLSLWSIALLCLTTLTACKRDDMADQAKFKPLSASAFYPDGASARLPVTHTVDRAGVVAEDWSTWKTARSAGSGAHWTTLTDARTFPFPITRIDLERGQQVFEIDCSECHGLLGNGDGMVPERGFTRPPSYYSDRLRAASPAYYYDVMTNGIGAMFPYADRVTSDDRWRVAAYIKALQLSAAAPLNELTPDDRAKITAAGGGAR